MQHEMILPPPIPPYRRGGFDALQIHPNRHADLSPPGNMCVFVCTCVRSCACDCLWCDPIGKALQILSRWRLARKFTFFLNLKLQYCNSESDRVRPPHHSCLPTNDIWDQHLVN